MALLPRHSWNIVRPVAPHPTPLVVWIQTHAHAFGSIILLKEAATFLSHTVGRGRVYRFFFGPHLTGLLLPQFDQVRRDKEAGENAPGSLKDVALFGQPYPSGRK